MSLIYKDDFVQANGGRTAIEVLLADSTEYSVGDAVKIDAKTGTLVLWGAGGKGAGTIVSFKKADGSPVVDNGAGSDFTDTYTTPASNTVVAVIDASKNSIYSVTLDDTIGTTSGSNKVGVNFDLVAASDQIDEDTVQDAGTTASFVSLGVDNDPTAADNSILVKIQESQFDI